MLAAVCALSAVLVAVSALDNGLARTPPMGLVPIVRIYLEAVSLQLLHHRLPLLLLFSSRCSWNSWNIYGAGVTAKDLQDTADFFVSSGLAAAGKDANRGAPRTLCSRVNVHHSSSLPSSFQATSL